jgi:hypothetical protein
LVKTAAAAAVVTVVAAVAAMVAPAITNQVINPQQIA